MSIADLRPLSRPQLVTLRAAEAGAVRFGCGRLVVAADFSVSRVTMASVRACQRRGVLEQVNPVTGYFPLTDDGRDVLANGCIKCGCEIEPENTCVEDGEDRVCFACAGAPRL